MSALTLSDVTNILIDYYGETIIDNVVRQGVGNRLVREDSIHGRLAAKGRVFLDGGDGSDRFAKEWSVHHSGSTANSFDQDDSYPSATQESYAKASLAWKRVGLSMQWDNLLRTSKGVGRGGTHPVLLDFEYKLKELMSEVSKQLAADGTGNSSKDITGFKAALSTSNTYATINKATATYWQANLTAAGAASLARSHFRALLQTLENSRLGVGPNSEIWMNIVQWHKYADLFRDSIRYAPGQGGEALAPMYDDGGYSLPIFRVRDIPTDEVWIVDTDQVELRFKTHSPVDDLAPGDAEEMYEGVPIAIDPVYLNRDVKSLFLKVYAQLIVTNPFAQSAITGLAT